MGLRTVTAPAASSAASSKARRHADASALSAGEGLAATRNKHVDAFSRNGYGFSPGSGAGSGGNGSGGDEGPPASLADDRVAPAPPRMSGARRLSRWSHRSPRMRGDRARHAATLCGRRIAASKTPIDPSKKTVAGETARAASLSALSSLASRARRALPPPKRPPPPRGSEPPPPPARPRIVDSVLRGRFSHAPPARSSWSLIARGPPKYSVPSRTIAITASVAAALSWPGAPARSRAEIGAASNVSSASRASVRNATSRGGRRFIPFPLGSRESHAQSSAWSASRARLRNAARTWRFDSRASPGTISSLCDTTRRRSGASDAATAARAEDD